MPHVQRPRRHHRRSLHRLVALGGLLQAGIAAAAIPVYGYKVVHVYPHDTAAYTEGLFYRAGVLYESTGQVGRSGVRKVALETGEVLQHADLPPPYFGEGIIDRGDQLIQLTWQHQTGFVRDLASFAPLSQLHYAGEGWGLTRNATHIFMSDGTNVLRVLDPRTLAPVAHLAVTADGVPVNRLNELEWVGGEIYANVWLTDRIARIDPASGRVTGWIDLSGLMDPSRLAAPEEDVANGIAWDAANGRLFVTGKCWPSVFEITLLPKPAG